VQRLERAELLGDYQRGVVGQHHAAGADPDRGGGGGDRADQDGRGRAGDTGHSVVLGHPDAGEAELVGAHGERERCPQGLGGARARAHGRDVQHGQRERGEGGFVSHGVC
jgi:hypothetical protein